MKLFKKASIYILAGLMALSSFNVLAAERQDAQPVKEQQKENEVRLQDDFYTAVNQKWLENATLDTGYAVNNSFYEADKRCSEQIDQLFDMLLKHQKEYKSGSSEKNMVTYYNDIINVKVRDAQGMAPIKEDWERVQAISKLEDISKYLSDPGNEGIEALFNINIATDLKDSNRRSVYLNISSLVLGNADYYNKPTDYSKNMEKETTAYMTNILQLYGFSKEEAESKVNELYKYEKMLAPYCRGQEEASKCNNIDEVSYNVYTMEDLKKAAPHIPFKDIMAGLGLEKVDRVIVSEPKWLAALDAVYTEKNAALIKNAIEVHFLLDQAGCLSTDFQKAAEDYMKKLSGVNESVPLEQQALMAVEGTFPNDIDKLYVEKYFSEAAKKDVEELVKEIISKYKEKIQSVDWMTEATKKNAIDKLDKMIIKIGYPDKWETYDGLVLKSYEEGGSLYENKKTMLAWQRQYLLNNLDKPIDKQTFSLSCHTVNAQYQPTCNDITFPAAILQEPFYDINRSREANLGGIGAVIAHEISHAFDTTGANYDAEGNLKNWWTKEDYDRFAERTDKVRNYYSNVVTDSGEKVNGDLTVGENVADITSISCMLDIMKEMDDPDYDAFFRAWAVTWRQITTPEYAAYALNNDVHSPNKVRVNATLAQFQEFYDTYGIKEGDALYVKPENRLKIY